MNKFYVLVFSILLSANLYSATESITEKMLPQQNMKMQNIISANNSTNSVKWNKFTNEYGNWNVNIDKYTNTPVNAYGKAINITGNKVVNKENIIQSANEFLQKNSVLFNTSTENLKLTNIRKVRDKWYVSYKQYYNGYEVLLSEVELRIFENGNLMAFRVKTYNDINISTEPALSLDEAINSNMNNIKSNNLKLLSKNDDILILPVFNGNDYGYSLVYNYEIRDNSTATSYNTFTDANTGDVLWRQRTSHNFSSKITSSGHIQKEHPNSPIVNDVFPYQRIDINGVTYYTDVNGELETELEQGDIIEAHFEGKYGKVSYQYDVPTVFVDTIDADGDYDLHFDNNNSRVYDRFGYYHVNHIRHWLKEFDTDITALDIPIDVVFLDDYMGYKMVNAFSNENGDTIAFIGFEDSEARLSVSPSVLYHEYGHGINTRVYKEQGATYGMTNLSLHEALADATSAFVLDDPRVGANVFANDPDKVIRTIENDYVYPDDLQGDSHHNGLILAGALWDIRNSVSLEFVREISHFARYGTPDDADIGTTFSEYFIEFLIAADDDGDISNGTPYFNEIVAAFNRHQIGTNLIINNSLLHTPLLNTEYFEYPFEVDFSFDTNGIIGTEIDSAFVIYKLNDSEKLLRVKADLTDNFNSFIANIPELDNPALVHYKFEYYAPFTEEAVYYPTRNDDYYTFLAGYSLMLGDNLENDEFWTMGDSEDNASGGLFEIAIPKRFELNIGGTSYKMQPGEDHSEFGNKCLITGNDLPSFGNPFSNSLLSGITSAITPEYNLSNKEGVLLSFYVWNMALVFSSNASDGPYLKVFISDTDGLIWDELQSFTVDNVGEWNQKMIYIPAEYNSNVKFKFTASSPSPNQTVTETLIDDIELLIPSQGTSVSDESEIEINTYPNPFADRITIENKNYDAAIYDLSGNKIYDIPLGITNWNGITNNGSKVNSGVYIIKINTGTNIITKKIIKL